MQTRTLAKSWRNPLAGGITFGITAFFFAIALLVPPYRGWGYAAYEAICLVACSVLTWNALGSACVWVTPNTLYASRLSRRRLAIERTEIASVTIKAGQLGLRPGRCVELTLKSGRAVALGELHVPLKAEPSPKVEGLADQIRQWLAEPAREG